MPRNKTGGKPKGRKVRSELKHPKLILKERKVREKNILRHERGKARKKKANWRDKQLGKGKKGKIKVIDMKNVVYC